MRLQPTTRLLLLALLPAATLGIDEFDAATPPLPPRTATLYSWPLNAPTPAPFATISFNARSLTGAYAPIKNAPSPSSNELVRVGTTDKTNAAAGSVTVGGLVGKASGVEITLRLDAAGNAWHVQLSENLAATTPKVTVVRDVAGVVPVLNKPIVLGPDGTIPQPVVEKTLFQKYWWVFLAVFILLVGGGGGE